MQDQRWPFMICIVTANYLLRSNDVWVRRGQFVAPDNARPYDALATTSLAGVHRRVVEAEVSRLCGG